MKKLPKSEPEIKCFNFKMPVYVWKMIKISALHMDISMNDFILRAVENCKPEIKSINS